jgi:hypothetical protein
MAQTLKFGNKVWAAKEDSVRNNGARYSKNRLYR